MKYKSKEYYEAEKEFNKLSLKEQEEIMKESKEISDWLHERLIILLPVMFKRERPELKEIYQFSSMSEEFCQKFNKAPIDFIEYVKMFQDSLQHKLNQVSFDKPKFDFKNDERKRKIKKEIYGKNDDTASIGNDQINKLKKMKENMGQ